MRRHEGGGATPWILRMSAHTQELLRDDKPGMVPAPYNDHKNTCAFTQGCLSWDILSELAT